MALEGFWSDYSIEPKRKFRWVLSFRGIPQWILKRVTKPNFTVETTEHSFINYKFYYPGRVSWEEVSLTLADPVYPDASATMMQLVRDMGYVMPHNFLNDGGERSGKVVTISKQSAVQALGGAMYLQQMDAEGDLIEEWKLYNPFITGVSFDELDYESDDLLNLELTVRYDWAELQNVGNVFQKRVDRTAQTSGRALGQAGQFGQVGERIPGTSPFNRFGTPG